MSELVYTIGPSFCNSFSPSKMQSLSPLLGCSRGYGEVGIDACCTVCGMLCHFLRRWILQTTMDPHCDYNLSFYRILSLSYFR